jgi:hypothetical protein
MADVHAVEIADRSHASARQVGLSKRIVDENHGRGSWARANSARIIAYRHKLVRLKALLLFAALAATFAGGIDHPSRPPVKGCKWEKLSDTALGLDAWVQRCDFGFRKIDLFTKGSSLYIHYSDGGAPDPLIDVLPLLAGETAEAAIKRIFALHTPAKLAKRCVLAPYSGEKRPGVERFTFIPNAAFQKQLDAKADPNEVGDPPCGDWGDAPDGIQYFEAHPGAHKVLFVRVGQDEPLFDEKTLRLTK